jgi:ketosteroid isomerase-like protein
MYRPCLTITPVEIGKGTVMNLATERERLLRRDAEWAEIALEGQDVERILSYWTDDAVVLAPGLPRVSGKAALREYVQGSMRIPGFKITWESKEAVLSPDGQLAYIFSRNAVTLNAADGTPVTTDGRGVTIWRHEPDSQWRCAVDIWNAELA